VFLHGAQTSGGARGRLQSARTLTPVPQICAVPGGHGRDYIVRVVQKPHAEVLSVGKTLPQ